MAERSTSLTQPPHAQAGASSSSSRQVGDGQGRPCQPPPQPSALCGDRYLSSSSSDSAPGAPPEKDLDLAFTHTMADFDSLAAAVGVARLQGSACKVCVPGGESPPVRRFLSLYRHFFPFIDAKLVDPRRIRHMYVVDAHKADRLGAARDWSQHAVTCTVYDHHALPAGGGGGGDNDNEVDIRNDNLTLVCERVGAVTTMIVERIRRAGIGVRAEDATLFALGIHADTGSLTFDGTTPRDAAALAWLLEHGASQNSIAEFHEDQLSEVQQRLLSEALERMQRRECYGRTVGHVMLESEEYVRGMAVVAQDLLMLSNTDVLLLGIKVAVSPREGRGADCGGGGGDARDEYRLSIIGRARTRVDGIDLGSVLSEHGGGGHARAAALSLRAREPDALLRRVTERACDQIPEPRKLREFMSTNVVTVTPDMNMSALSALFERTRFSGVPVIEGAAMRHARDNDDDDDAADSEQQSMRYLGVVSKSDVIRAVIKGVADSTPVKAWMREAPALGPNHTVNDAETLLMERGIGRVPVVDGDGRLIGIVTRTDVLVQRQMCTADAAARRADDAPRRASPAVGHPRA